MSEQREEAIMHAPEIALAGHSRMPGAVQFEERIAESGRHPQPGMSLHLGMSSLELLHIARPVPMLAKDQTIPAHQ
jgi:hypothetical protein